MLKNDVNLFRKIGIVGAGVTGIGMTKISIDKGIKIILVDFSSESLESAQTEIIKYLDAGVQRKRFTKSERDEFFAALTLTPSFDRLKDVGFVVEAIDGELDEKRKVIRQLESIVSEECVIASTSFALRNIASDSVKPERIVGMHYSIPIEKTQILEIITSDSTSSKAVAKSAKLGLTQKKLIIPVKEPSFLIRCLIPVASEVVNLLREGYSPTEIDAFTKSAGFHVGCVSMIDGIGIDLITVAAKTLSAELEERENNDSIKVLEELVKSGFHGRKTNLGMSFFFLSIVYIKIQQLNKYKMYLFLDLLFVQFFDELLLLLHSIDTILQ